LAAGYLLHSVDEVVKSVDHLSIAPIDRLVRQSADQDGDHINEDAELFSVASDLADDLILEGSVLFVDCNEELGVEESAPVRSMVKFRNASSKGKDTDVSVISGSLTCRLLDVGPGGYSLRTVIRRG
jgi:hypothetical protein